MGLLGGYACYDGALSRVLEVEKACLRSGLVTLARVLRVGWVDAWMDGLAA